MFKKDVIAYFDPDLKRSKVAAEKLGCTPGLVSQWGEIIPERWAYKCAVISGGKLPFRPDLYGRVA